MKSADDEIKLKVIAHVRTDFPTKFGLPRQSGMVGALTGRVVFERAYRNPDALRGLMGYSHVWLIWGFTEAKRETWLPMVRPPRLGGNTPMGVFATRSPYRPNPIGLSVVELVRIEETEEGEELIVRGIDMLDGTPIYDIKPYLPHVDSVACAKGGFAEAARDYFLDVCIPEQILREIPLAARTAVIGALSLDPRPAYQHDPKRRYGFIFRKTDVRFRVDGQMLTVCELAEPPEQKDS